jgi:Family of unknown function (DUF6459)
MIPHQRRSGDEDAGATVLTQPRADGRPDPAIWTIRLAQAVAEVLAGARSAVQLADLITLDVRRLLERSAGRFGAIRRGDPPRVPPPRPLVASVHVTEPAERVIEACAVITTGPRARVVAFRLEAAGATWRCTAVHIG